MLIVSVLGESEFVAGSTAVALGARLARRFATRLALSHGETVTDDAIVDAVWGEHAPAQAAASIQAFVSRLRRNLGDHRDHLERVGSGYRLRVDGTDVSRFEEVVERADANLASHPAQAADAAAEALRLWRGEPYSDLTDAPVAAAERSRLVELHETVVEVNLDAQLRLGRAAHVVADARTSAEAAPFRERRWALLILALYRTGRQSDALQTLRQVRRLLDDELGIDPGPELQDLERRIFSSDPGLLLDAKPAPTPPSSTVGPRRPLTSFHGRTAEMTSLGALLQSERLITLTGVGGVGKTRMVVEWAASRSQATTPTWLVRLADLTATDSVAAAAARSVGLVETGPDPTADLAAAIGARPGLLILDNCEHLLAQTRDYVSALLDLAPALQIIATSRELLGVEGEALLPLEPLPVQATDGGDGPAVDLLRERIARVRPGYAPTPAELVDVRRLCAMLDGLPLAVELAAARTRALSVNDIITRMDGRFQALADVPAGSLAPHRTLTDTISWSIDLLSPADRTLLDRLWPFEAGFTLELASGLADPDASDTTVLTSLASLVTKSLIVADTQVTPTRYRLWETLRAFEREHDPHPHATADRHAGTVAELVDEAAQMLRSPRSGRAMTVLTRELANIRAMLHHDLQADPRRALQSFTATGWFWYRSGLVAEGLSWIASLSTAVTDPTPAEHAQLLAVTAVLHHAAGNWPAVGRTINLLTAELADLPESSLHGQTAYYRAMIHIATRHPEQALTDAHQAVQIGARLEDRTVEANGHVALGLAQLNLGLRAEGEQSILTAIAAAEQGGSPWPAGMASLHLARAQLDQTPPRLHDAEEALQRAAAIFDVEGDLGNLTETMAQVARLLAHQGQTDEAYRTLDVAVGAAHRLGIRNQGEGLVPAELQSRPPVTSASSGANDPIQALRLRVIDWTP